MHESVGHYAKAWRLLLHHATAWGPWKRVISTGVTTALVIGVLSCVDRTPMASATLLSHVPPNWATLGDRYSQPPVDARIDRVWHAIPGLSGWSLDVHSSQRATRDALDGNVHLRWRAVPASRRLSDLSTEPIYRACAAERSVSLMINVSWGEQYVPTLLRELQQAGVHATFFLDGSWVQRHPEVAQDIAAYHEDVGSHGSGHPDFRTLTIAQLTSQVRGTNQVIRNTVGVSPRLLAPPGGAYDARTVAAAHAAGMYTILWSDDSLDWRRPPSQVIVRRVMTGVHPGALILLHPTAPTASALPAIIDQLKNAGYAFRTVSEVVDERPAYHPPQVLRAGV